MGRRKVQGCAVADVESKLVKVAVDLTHEMLIGLGLTTHDASTFVKSARYAGTLDGEETVLVAPWSPSAS